MFIQGDDCHLVSYRGFKSSVYDGLSPKKDKFTAAILCVVNRLKRDLPLDDDDSESDSN